ncbi:universal stress protein [Kushneria indalinina]|uniref:Nucleotide-binding universal stress UspA family protein n=1 Tax=Kushneria indalinina DSM 14324 TaxID=1122140 RepID=A0A3D9DRV1_9GAMM|nr:universal stress protein [Kushneria indalinina]REC93493.1 nucleotide-binding universal stress UspA family protein [Kushneria indalinina DSM 14324]
MYRTILVPLDGSGNANKALDIAAHLARANKARLYLLHVPAIDEENGASPETTTVSRDDAAMQLVQTALETIDPSDLDTSIIVREGQPAEMIEREAHRLDADAIVMGYRGLGRTSDIAGGSVSRTVNQHAACRVITVR